MMIKKMIGLLTGTIIFFGVVASASGSVTCSSATITQVGIDPSQENTPYYVRVTCQDTEPVKWDGPRLYYLMSGMGDAGLAMLLTAYSTGAPVKVNLSSFTSLSLLEDLRILSAQ